MADKQIIEEGGKIVDQVRQRVRNGMDQVDLPTDLTNNLQLVDKVGDLQNALAGQQENVQQILGEYVDNDMIDSCKEEFARFRVALKDVVDKCKTVASQAAEKYQHKADEAR